jgi:hypothetical protein
MEEYNQCTVTVQECMIKPLDITFRCNIKLHADYILVVGYHDDGHRSDCTEMYDKTT